MADFDGAVMHTPVEVTEQALAVLREAAADCLVAVGGGSTTGLSKALALRTDLPQVILPTTYAGSEVTPVLGETRDGRKVTQSSAAILPETVVYDIAFTSTLRVGMSVTSGVNAMAHAVEALYSADANPVTDGQALEAISRIARALPRLADDPTDPGARADLLHAAWLAGTCLATVGMGLHHKLCHTLGGSFDLPHAETHTVVLPHAMAYNAAAAPDAMRRIAEALGTADAPSGVHDLIASLGGPTSLRDLGMPESDLAKAAELAAATPPEPARGDRRGRGPRCCPTPGPGADRARRPTPSRPRWPASPSRSGLLRTGPGSTRSRPPRRPRPASARLRDGQRPHRRRVAVRDRLPHPHRADLRPTRQEFVLLSDTLGISSAVDLLTNSRTPTTTPSAVLGPFYVEGPPETEHGSDISGGLPGTPLWVDVRVLDTAGEPLKDAVVDVWQSNEDGFYDVQLPDLDGPVLRAGCAPTPRAG